MKRIFLLLIIVLTFYSVFASANIVNVSFSPYSFQNIFTTSGINDNSSYGFGAKLGYGYKISGSFVVGAEASYSRFSYEKLYNNEKYNVFTFLAKAGYSVNLFKPVVFYMDLGVGIDIRMLHEVSKVNPSFGAQIGIDFLVSKTMFITTGADLKLAILSKSRDLALLTNIGVAFAF